MHCPKASQLTSKEDVVANWQPPKPSKCGHLAVRQGPCTFLSIQISSVIGTQTPCFSASRSPWIPFTVAVWCWGCQLICSDTSDTVVFLTHLQISQLTYKGCCQMPTCACKSSISCASCHQSQTISRAPSALKLQVRWTSSFILNFAWISGSNGMGGDAWGYVKFSCFGSETIRLRRWPSV